MAVFFNIDKNVQKNICNNLELDGNMFRAHVGWIAEDNNWA